jgi:hyperosmotically inducible protein
LAFCHINWSNINMDTKSFRKTLIAASLITGFGVSAAAFAEPAASPAPQAHSDSVGAAISDTAITAKVKAKLMGEDSLKKSDVDVTTTNGVVTLKGWVSNADGKSVAEAGAKSVEGVKSVDNSLELATGSPKSDKAHKAVAKTKRVMSDSWITTKVKSMILTDSVSKGFKVDVKTKHGVVILAGDLASQDAIDHVKDIAGKVKGVKSVDTSGLIVSSK